MNTTKTKSYFSSRCARIAVLLALLACSLPSIGNDGRDPRHIKYVYGLYIFWHDTPTWDAASHYTVTYKDTTYNTYSGDIFIPYHNNNYLIDEIGDCAFKDCVGLNTIDMGFMNKVIRIDSCSFQNCTSLDSVTMSYCLNYVGDRAFHNCTNLRAITFSSSSLTSYPSNITHVGDGAFQNCYRLPSLYLPNLRYIGSNAFENCWAFTSFSIPGNVTSVGEAAFKGCHNLDTVYIQGCDNLPLGKNAFAECESLKAIICTSLIPPVVDQDLGLTPEQKATVKVIVPKMALEAYRQAPYWKDMAGLTTRTYDFEAMNSGKPMYFNIISDDEVCITYKDTTYNSYEGNYTMSDVDFFEMREVTWRCMGIPEKVTYNNKTYRVTAIGENAFRNCTKIDKIKWSSKPIKVIGSNAFKGCSNLKYVDLPGVLETIGKHAFEDCASLHYIEIPESVKSIEEYAFQNCSSLKWMYLFSALTIEKGAFHNANLKGHKFSEGVAIFCAITTPPIIADSTAFDESHYSNSVVCVLHSFENVFRADDNWNRFARYSHLIYDFQENYTYYRIDNDEEVSIVTNAYVYMNDWDIPSTVDFLGRSYTVRNIEDNALKNLVGNNITMPNTIKRIGAKAFANSFINSITIGDSVEVIGVGAFNESEMRNIYIPKSVNSIGDYAFINTQNLEFITVEEGNPVYDSRENCNALIHSATNRLIAGAGGCRVIPSSVTSIADSAFYGNLRLTEITIPNSINRIANGAFVGCANLSKIMFSDSLKSIGGLAFFANISLTTVEIPNSVESIESGAFGLCSSLQNITLGSRLKFIGTGAFATLTLMQYSVDSVICLATTPPVMESPNCFEGAYGQATLLVPQASLQLYKNDPNWSQFYKIVAIESSGIDEITVDDGAPKVRYNMQGQPVDDDYRGIVIENGRKILKP